jgi:hypothetical protein
MFCPGCGSEYRDGIFRCGECDVDLVVEPPRVEQRGDPDLVAILTTSDSALLPLVKSMLDAAGIPYVVQGEETLGMFPLGRFGVGVTKRMLGAIVRVPADRADEARELLDGVDAIDDGDPA